MSDCLALLSYLTVGELIVLVRAAVALLGPAARRMAGFVAEAPGAGSGQARRGAHQEGGDGTDPAGQEAKPHGRKERAEPPTAQPWNARAKATQEWANLEAWVKAHPRVSPAKHPEGAQLLEAFNAIRAQFKREAEGTSPGPGPAPKGKDQGPPPPPPPAAGAAAAAAEGGVPWRVSTGGKGGRGR